MKATGIIAEYNPFHNGHKYQLDTVRAKTGCDYIIIAMSGDFVQRGMPAIVDKYERTQMALSAGADLVLELPVIYATGSAEIFASAGVQLLGNTGVVNLICYGCEDDNPGLRKELAALLTDEPEEYAALLRDFLRRGESFPSAREHAIGELCNVCSKETLHRFLSSANNILALEYEKALLHWNRTRTNSMCALGILRAGEGYHSSRLSSLASATAIRKVLSSSGDLSLLKDALPPESLGLLAKALENQLLVEPDAFSAMLYARLWTFRKIGYESFAGCSRELSNKIVKNLDSFLSLTQFAGLLKSRNLTYTGICRALLHILLDIRKSDNSCGKNVSIPYLRVLGFRRESAGLLSTIKKEASVPLLTKAADASRRLSSGAKRMLDYDFAAADLYRTAASIQSAHELPNEFRHSPVIL